MSVVLISVIALIICFITLLLLLDKSDTDPQQKPLLIFMFNMAAVVIFAARYLSLEAEYEFLVFSMLLLVGETSFCLGLFIVVPIIMLMIKAKERAPEGVFGPTWEEYKEFIQYKALQPTLDWLVFCAILAVSVALAAPLLGNEILGKVSALCMIFFFAMGIATKFHKEINSI